ncbi:MAG: hypothetical protein PVG93_04600 [Phycisphaerales bacterium]|jgi:hypothetical protein
MLDLEKAKKLGADKIVLLSLFALSLLIARVIVAMKTSIVLSKPVELRHSGLSIRLPDKNGWQCAKDWEYKRNAFVLSSLFNPGGARVSANIRCIYLFAADRGSPRDWLEEEILRFEAESTQTGASQTEGLTFDWVYLTEKDSPANMLIATARLPEGRWLDIEIVETVGESELISQVFEKIIANLRFEQNELLQTGGRVVEQIKDKGLTELIPNQGVQLFFVVKNAAEENIGFAMDHVDRTSTYGADNIEGAGFLYTRTPRAREEASMFQCDDKLSQLSWQSQTRIGNMRSSRELNISSTGLLTVMGQSRGGGERQYLLNPAAVPYAVIEAVFNQMITDNLQEIMVDIIYHDGQVKPVVISFAEPGPSSPDSSSDAVYIVKLQQLNEDRIGEEFHLDNQMNAIKRIIKQNGIYILQSSTLEDVIRMFPERADDVLQRSRMLSGDKDNSF